MHSYPRAAVERMMNVQEVILRAMAKKITWWQAAEIIGITDRQMRRLHWRYREHGYDGLLDRRGGKPSPKRVPLAVVEQQGIFCALYSDRASHFFYTPRAGGKVDAERATQVGRALQEMNIRMIPAYSPQARGRSERGCGTWQGRLPQELRLQGMQRLEQANRFLREEYVAEFNQRFQVSALQRGSAFLPCRRKDLDVVFSVQQQRVVNRDNTVVVGGKVFQIEPTRWRGSLAGCSVTVCEHLDQTWSIRYGPHVVGRYNAQGWPWLCKQKLD